ncbi:MAG: PAS domain-containing sensor histidine kinase [Anaerolineae bacterium]|nr:PAS domain-containing sensor histidine kinase [Anaerolineae bacterium]
MIAWQYHPYMLPFFISTLVVVALFFVGWQRRSLPEAGVFLLLIIAVAIYALGYTLELGSQNVHTIIALAKLEYVGIATMPLIWLVLALLVTRQEQWLTRPRLLALAAVPILTVLFTWTNERHLLIWQSVTVGRHQGVAVWQSTYGPWFLVHIVYFNLLVLVGLLLLGQKLAGSSRPYRQQLLAMMLAVLFPWVACVAYFFQLLPVPINPTTFAFVLSGVCIAWALFRFRLFDLAPMARDVVMENMADGVVVLDTQGRIVDMNPAARCIAGGADGVGWPVTAVFPPLHPLFCRQPQPVVTHTEFAATLPDGRDTIYDGRLMPIYDRRQRLNGQVLMLQDITESQAAAAAMCQAKEAADYARQEAEAASRAKSAFLSNVSHELRTPLTVITLYTEIVHKLALSKGYDELLPRLSQISTSARHLSEVVNDILDLSKIEAGVMELHEELFDVRHLLDELVVMTQPLIARNDNRLHLSVANDLGYIYTDPTKLRQVLLNLLSNAAKFTERGEIKLNVTHDHSLFNPQTDVICFELQDTGIGMTPEQTEEVFQPFTQLDNSLSRKYQGTGLGLTISRHYCEMMAGDITVHSEPQKGSTFTVKIPTRLVETQGVRAMPN